MFNPFIKFDSRMIEGLRNMKRPWVVSQLHVNGMDVFEEDKREAILLTDYDNIGLAKIHYNALTDKYRCILDLENGEHRNKILDLLAVDSGYIVYAAFIKSQEQVLKRLNDRYTRSIRNYILKNTSWSIGADKGVRPKLQVIFGKLFVILKYSGQEVRFQLDELELY